MVSRIALYSPHIVLVSVFGPYIVPTYGLRTEHVAVYALALFFVVHSATSIRTALAASGVPLLLWTFILLLAVWSSLVQRMETSSILAGIDNYALPIALAIVIHSHKRKHSRHSLRNLDSYISNVWTAFAILLSCNTILSVLQLSGVISGSDLAPFHTGSRLDLTPHSVADNAFAMGRFTGLFNQPLEHGVAYSVGLLMWTYAISRREKTAIDYLLLGGILLGGVLGVSKVFYLLCIPMWSAYQVSLSLRPRFSKLSCSGILVAFLGSVTVLRASAVELISGWAGAQRIVESVYLHDDLLLGWTAGRFRTDGTGIVADLIHEVWRESWMTGVGFGYLAAVDNAYVFNFMTGGVLGVVLYLCLLYSLTVAMRKVRSPEGAIARESYVLLIALVIFADLGGPTLILNRAGTIAWMFLFLHQRRSLVEYRMYLKQRRSTNNSVASVNATAKARVNLA